MSEAARGPSIRYEDAEEKAEGVRFFIVGANGEVQARSEWYDNHSNAKRGAGDLARTMAELVTIGKIAVAP